MVGILFEKAPPVLISSGLNGTCATATEQSFSLAPKLAGGSLKTVEFARKHGKPLIHVSAVDPDPAGRL
jgi:hypothetical protein